MKRTVRGELVRCGFTLMELLTVAALLTLLTALLLPLLIGAREEFRQCRCLSNLRQIGIAHRLYVQDWDDQLPNWEFPAPPRPAPLGKRQFWTEYLQPYLRSEEVLHDPGAHWPLSFGDEGRVTEGEKLAEYTLATWGRGGNGTRRTPYWRWAGRPMRLAEVVRPAETLLVLDGWTIPSWTGIELGRHRDGLNACFVDGHGARLSRGEFWRVEQGADGSHWRRYAAADRGD